MKEIASFPVNSLLYIMKKQITFFCTQNQLRVQSLEYTYPVTVHILHFKFFFVLGCLKMLSKLFQINLQILYLSNIWELSKCLFKIFSFNYYLFLGNYLKDLINLSVKGFNTDSLKFVYSAKKSQWGKKPYIVTMIYILISTNF